MGEHDAFEQIFKSFPLHKKHWLLSAPNKSKHSFCGGAAPREGLLHQHAQSLYCLRRFTSKKRQKSSNPASTLGMGLFGGDMRTWCHEDCSHRCPLCWSTRSQFNPAKLPAACHGCLCIPHKALFLWHIYIKHMHSVHHRWAGGTSARAGQARNNQFIALCHHPAAPCVQAWGGEMGIWFWFVFFIYFFPFSRSHTTRPCHGCRQVEVREFA